MAVSEVMMYRSTPTDIADTTSAATASAATLLERLGSFRDQLEGEQSEADMCNILAAHGLVNSALFVLLDKHCCPRGLDGDIGSIPSIQAKSVEQLDFQARAMTFIQYMSRDIASMARKITLLAAQDMPQDHGLGRFSPFAFDTLYCAAMTFRWLQQESGAYSQEGNLEAIQDCFSMLSKRWTLATEYLSIASKSIEGLD